MICEVPGCNRTARDGHEWCRTHQALQRQIDRDEENARRQRTLAPGEQAPTPSAAPASCNCTGQDLHSKTHLIYHIDPPRPEYHPDDVLEGEHVSPGVVYVDHAWFESNVAPMRRRKETYARPPAELAQRMRDMKKSRPDQ